MKLHYLDVWEFAFEGGNRRSVVVRVRFRATNFFSFGFISCFAISLYFAAAVTYAILHFEWYGSAPPQFYRYIAAPGALSLIFLLAALLLRGKTRTLVGVYATAVLAALFVFEAYLTYQILPILLANVGQLDEGQRAAVRNEKLLRGFTLRRLNILMGTLDLPDVMLSGFPGARTLLCSPPGKIIAYTADRLGFNNPDSVYDRPIDVMVVGDSFAEGFCLLPGKDFVSQLRAGGINAVGLGIRGNGPLIELATLGRYGPLLQPRHVIWAFFEGNDWKNLEFELKTDWLRPALEANADFGSPNLPSETVEKAREFVKSAGDKPVTMIDFLLHGSTIRNFFALHKTSAAVGLYYPRVAGKIPEFRRILERAKAITNSWGGQFRLLYIPRAARFAGLYPPDEIYDQLRDKVVEAAHAENVPVIDMVPRLRQSGRAAAFFASNAHFNKKGAAFAANMILGRVVAQGPADAMQSGTHRR